MTKTATPVKLGTCVHRVAANLVGDAVVPAAVVSKIWSQIVGKNLARCSAVLSLSTRRISVVVRNEQIHKEIRYLQPHILGAVSQWISGVSLEKLDIVIDNRSFVDEFIEKSMFSEPRSPVFTSESVAIAKSVCAVIPDEELRTLFETWMCTHRSLRQFNGLS